MNGGSRVVNQLQAVRQFVLSAPKNDSPSNVDTKVSLIDSLMGVIIATKITVMRNDVTCCHLSLNIFATKIDIYFKLLHGILLSVLKAWHGGAHSH